MSNHVDRTEDPPGVELEGGLDELRQSPEFGGPVEPSDDHEHANDHYALIYESPEEQFAAVVPFVRRGLERGEHVLYVPHENDEEEVLEALREGGVDVDAALESGQLRVTSVHETYLREGRFDVDDALEVLADGIEEAVADFEGFRVAVEETWLLEAGPIEEFLALESRVNRLFEDEDALALCQYNRGKFPPEVIDDVIQTHPHLVHEETVSQNFYYTPPEEYFGPDRPERDIDRKLGTLRERTGMKTQLEANERYLRELYETTADNDLAFEEKVRRLLELGCDRFDLGMGFLLEKRGDEFRVVAAHGADLEEGTATLSAGPGHYCRRTVTMEQPLGVPDAAAAGWDDDPVYREYDLGCYLGTKVTDGSGVYGSLCFAADATRDRAFSDAEYTFLDLMGQWLSYELQRQQYESDLEETVERLQQSNERLTQFAYAASHDLQEPLRMVSSYLQLLESDYGDDLEEEAREYLDIAVQGADRMRAMVDDLLAYSRVEQGDQDFEDVDPEAVLQQVQEDLRMQLEETGADLEVGPLPTVRGDPEQLEQLFGNLVSNALKYNEGTPHVRVTAEERGDHVELAVADDGIGIDPEKTDRIFEVFKRLHHGDEYPGTGIGLSLCQEIVDGHGGDIRVESTPGEGSTFYVTLPRAG